MWSVALGLLMTFGGLAPASAGEPDAAAIEQAQRHAARAKTYYEEGDFAAAQAEYLRAYALAPRPALLYNLAQCADRLGQTAETLDHLKRYLAALPDAEDRTPIERWIAKLEGRAGEAFGPGPAPPEPASGRLFTWITLGLSAGAAGAGLALGVTAQGDYDDLVSRCGAVGCPASEVDGVGSTALAANVLFGAAGALFVSSVVLWFVEDAP